MDRRGAIACALAAALAPALAGRAARAQALDGHLIDPPDASMIFRREVERDLADGRKLRVARDFAVRFERFEGGFMLAGRQHGVEVDAPPALARFADLERARDESGMFPLALDAFGRIVSEDSAAAEGDEVDRAFEEALSVLRSAGLPQSEDAMLRQFVAAVHAAGEGITAHLPVDLFAPAAAPRQEEQRLALPGGLEGVVSTVFAGETDRSTGLMSRATRRVTTRTDAVSRTAREEWTLSLL